MPDLVLVPTLLELEKLRPLLERDVMTHESGLQLCGFGLVAAAARASALISRYKASRVLLIGIAGSFDLDRFPLGTACRFDQVVCDGIGLGTGSDHRAAGQLGWQQFSGGDAQPEIGDVIPLISTFVSDVPCAGTLLSVCSASANQREAEWRRQRYPAAIAEDMEGFAVAMACTLAGVPLQVVRGISNRVGDRDTQRWQIDEALAAAAEMANDLVPRNWIPTQT